MKKLFGLVWVALATMPVLGAGIVATNLYEFQSTGPGTSNSIAIASSTITLPTVTFLIQNSNLVNTNALRVYQQFSLDGTNFVTTGTYGPTRTNALIDTFTIPANSFTGYIRAVITTTNDTTVKVMSIR